MPDFDRVVHLVNTVDSREAFPFEVDGSNAGLSLTVQKGSGANYFNSTALRVRLRKNGTAVTSGTITGQLDAGAVLNINDTLFTLREPMKLGDRWNAPTTFLYQPGGLSLALVLGELLPAMRPTLDSLIALTGVPAEGIEASAGDGVPNPYTRASVRNPVFWSGGIIERTIDRRLDVIEPKQRLGAAVRVRAVVSGLPTKQFDNRYVEHTVRALLPANEGLALLQTAITENYPSSTPVQVVAGGGAISGGRATWATLDDYTVGQQVFGEGSDAQIKETFIAAWIVPDFNASVDTFDVLIDEEGQVWDIQGISVIDRRTRRVECQRTA